MTTSIERLKQELDAADEHDFETADKAVFRYLETTLIDNGKEGMLGMKLLEIIKKNLMP